jgi:hypothetical protein
MPRKVFRYDVVRGDEDGARDLDIFEIADAARQALSMHLPLAAAMRRRSGWLAEDVPQIIEARLERQPMTLQFTVLHRSISMSADIQGAIDRILRGTVAPLVAVTGSRLVDPPPPSRQRGAN